MSENEEKGERKRDIDRAHRQRARERERERELTCDEQLALWVAGKEAVLVEEVVDHAREHLHDQGFGFRVSGFGVGVWG